MRTAPALVTTALVAASLLVATPASAAPLTCGSTVTASASLTTDLTCSGDGTALTLGAGVTLDLRGHTVSGSGAGVGIMVPHDGDVVIRNGTLTRFAWGVDTVEAGEESYSGTVSVDRVRFTDSGVGLDASGTNPVSTGKPTTVTRCRFQNLHIGIEATWFARVQVSASKFSDLTYGLHMDSSDADVSDSLFVRVAHAIDGVESAADVHRSSFVDGDVAISYGFVGGGTIERSTFRRNGVAVTSSASYLALTGNTFTANTGAVNVAYLGGTISGNTFRRNGSALHADAPHELVVRDNVLQHNGDAIVVDEASANSSLGGNTATHNSGWGINAPGVTDAGGNSASGNGNEPQCVGVTCS
jgi:hypothetical protein